MTARNDRILPVHKDGTWIYDIQITDRFEGFAEALKNADIDGCRLCIVTDSHVAPLYAEEVKKVCGDGFSQVEVFVFPAGEAHKNLDTVRRLYEFLIQKHFDRKDVLIALGGGVTGDLTGYTAATYLRGIRFVQVPTTLLSQVDSSIGGKTGVDFDSYKNMVGAFHMPKLVYMNLNTLRTLPEREFSCGMAEIIKHGFIKDAEYLSDLLSHADEILRHEYEHLANMIEHSCKIKRAVVEMDPYEKGERMLLNFGHTLGHAIEKLMDFQMLHGECVAVGSVAAAWLSMHRGYISRTEYDTVRQAVHTFGLPDNIIGLKAEEILMASKSDKKMEGGRIKFILLHNIGDAYVDRSVTDKELLAALKEIEG